PYLQTFDGVTAPALPVQWSTLISDPEGTIASTTFSPWSNPNCVALNNNGSADVSVILVAPPYANTIQTNTTRVKLYARADGTGYTLSVGVLADPQNAATYTEIQQLTLSATWAEYVVSLGSYTGTGRTVALKHGLGGGWRMLYVDNVMLEVSPQNDLAALAVSGNTTPSVGMATTYSVSVFNWGTNPQSDYQVKLFKQGDIELNSVPGLPVNPGQTVQVPIGWTPTEQGATFIYGKVVMTGDQNNLNDQTPNYSVVVQPQGLVVLTVGDGSLTGRIPLDMFYMNSLYECIFYPAELSNTLGSIYGIGFYNNFVTDLPNMPVNIWLGTTTSADLSAGWIPSTQLTQVFSGTVNFPPGQNLINIPFPVPWLYLNGENLVMMVQRPMDNQYYDYQDVFATQDGVTGRSRNAYSDGTPFDPTSPPNVTPAAAYPRTSFFIIPGGVGHLTGTILGANNQPLEGVAISSAAGGYTAVTDASGHYLIQNIIDGEYQFSFSHYGYITHTQTVVIPEDETVTLNLTLQQMPMVTVSGTIIGSDTQAGLSGAGIYLQGYADYTTSTNATGAFAITGVYANFPYEYSILCPGYQNQSGTIAVGAGNYNFGTIVLDEVAYAPRQVHGEITGNNTQVQVTWLAPDPSALDVVESFEAESFPPQNWTQTITNTGPANTSGVYPTWCRFGAITISGQPAAPPDGSYQAGLWWSYNHQDEWLITPSFNCPPAAYLNFASYVFLGSTNGDHYYIKVSTDDGNSWSTLWDASAQTGGWNYYASPITVDLSLYEGLQLKIAWHADDPPSNDGLWYVWFIDDIYIGNAVSGVTFLPSDLELRSSGSASSAWSPAKPAPALQERPSALLNARPSPGANIHRAALSFPALQPGT
ncbi:MAG TPA: choice-of-anchor J domain-containing protein, partial [Candidatus Syntrophosphaera sp.]|nr:choice-of-anchor J domain-containing protein [Candidatus Syntrophosphaera sp.]